MREENQRRGASRAWARGFAVMCALLACLVALPLTAQAEEASSFEDLKQAVEGVAADASGEVTVTEDLAASGTITVQGNVTVTFGDATTVTREDAAALFDVTTGSLTIEGNVTVSGGTGSFATVRSGAALSVNGAVLAQGVSGEDSFFDVAGSLSMGPDGGISGWVANGSGSAVSVSGEGASLTMNGGEISGNTATKTGGGVRLADGATMTMTNGATVSNNVLANGTAEGAGIHVSGGSTLTANSAVISGNHGTYKRDWEGCQSQGGGIYVTGAGSTVTLTNTTVSGNRVAHNSNGSGGGIYATRDAAVSITGGSVSDNSGFISDDHLLHESGGGGLYVTGDATLTMSGVTVFNNTALLGAGIYLNGAASATIEGCSVTGNRTLRDPEPATSSYYNDSIGGGILVRRSGGTLTPPAGAARSRPSSASRAAPRHRWSSATTRPSWAAAVSASSTPR